MLRKWTALFSRNKLITSDSGGHNDFILDVFFKNIHILDKTENLIYSEMNDERAELAFVSAKWNMVPKSYCFLQLVLKALYVSFMFLALSSPTRACSRALKNTSACPQRHLDANMCFLRSILCDLYFLP